VKKDRDITKVFNPHLQYNFVIWLLIGVLLVYAAIATVTIIRNKPDIRIIAIEPTGTRLVSSDTDPVLEMERLKFLRLFAHLYNNYDAQTFEESVLKAFDWVTDEIWKSKEAEVKVTLENLQKTGTIQTAKVTRIAENAENQFEIEILATQYFRAKQVTKKGVLTLVVEDAVRSSTNPWGLVISSLSERWQDVD
jgi:hypothetical protein